MVKNISLIDKSKQNIVSDLCELATNTPVVKKLIIFGSTTQNLCNEDSDIDLCFDVTCDTQSKDIFDLSKSASKICDYNCDIFYYNLIGEKLKSEIDSKGVIVYEP